MKRDELVKAAGNIASNLRELADRFDLIKKAAEDNNDPLDDLTLRTLRRVIYETSARIDKIDKLSEPLGDLLCISIRKSNPGGSTLAPVVVLKPRGFRLWDRREL